VKYEARAWRRRENLRAKRQALSSPDRPGRKLFQRYTGDLFKRASCAAQVLLIMESAFRWRVSSRHDGPGEWAATILAGWLAAGTSVAVEAFRRQHSQDGCWNGKEKKEQKKWNLHLNMVAAHRPGNGRGACSRCATTPPRPRLRAFNGARRGCCRALGNTCILRRRAADSSLTGRAALSGHGPAGIAAAMPYVLGIRRACCLFAEICGGSASTA